MTLKVDLNQACSFLTSYNEELLITFQVYDDSKKTKRAEHFTACLADNDCAEYLTKANQSGLGVYFMFNEGDGQGRSNENVTALRALILDLDGAPLDPVLRCALAPHYVVESSKGRYQCHWIIDPLPLDTFSSRDAAKARFASLQKGLARKFSGDESVVDLARVFRVPGFYHQKATPFMSHVIEDNRGLPYSLEQIVDALELNEILTTVTKEIAAPLTEVEQLIRNKLKPGERHHMLVRYGSKYAHQYRMGPSERMWLLQGLNQHACTEPIPQRDLERINIQVGEYAATEAAKIDSVDISALVNKHQLGAENPDNILPRHLLNPPGMVGDMLDYILSSSVKPQPELALAAALCACGTVMGRKICTPTNLRTNIYCLFLTETGGGKDWPRQAIKRVFDAIGKVQRASMEEAASDAAISESVYTTPSQCFLFDEFGKLMKNVGSKNAGTHLASIPTLLMKLYSSAGGPFHTKSYANTDNNHTIYQPNVCLLGTTVQANFYKSITKEAVDDGLLNRILTFTSAEVDPPMRRITAFDPPESLLNQFRLWEGLPYRLGGGNLSDLETGENVQPTPRVVGFDDGAEEIFKDMESDLRAYRKEIRKQGLSGLYTRVYENAIKVSLIIAAGQNMYAPIITQADAQYACDLVMWLTNNAYREVRRHVSDSGIGAKHKAVLGLLRAAGGEGLTKTQLGQRCRDKGIATREQSEILKELIDWGCILMQESEPQSYKSKQMFYFVQESES